VCVVLRVSARGTEATVTTVQLSHELYQAAENLYIRLDLPQLIVDSLSTLSVPCQCRLLTNIILTGGNSRLSGLGPRLARDLQSLLPRTTAASVRVSDPRLMTGRSDAVIGAAYVRKWNHARWTTRRDYILDGHGLTTNDDDSANSVAPRAGDFSTLPTVVSSESNVSSCKEEDVIGPRGVNSDRCDARQSFHMSDHVSVIDDSAAHIASETRNTLSTGSVSPCCDGYWCSNIEEEEMTRTDSDTVVMDADAIQTSSDLNCSGAYSTVDAVLDPLTISNIS